MNLALKISEKKHDLYDRSEKRDLVYALLNSTSYGKQFYILGLIRYEICLTNGTFFTIDIKSKRSELDNINLDALINNYDLYIKSIKINFYKGYEPVFFGKPRKKILHSSEWDTLFLGEDPIGKLRRNKRMSSDIEKAFLVLGQGQFNISNIYFSRVDLVNFLLDMYRYNRNVFYTVRRSQNELAIN